MSGAWANRLRWSGLWLGPAAWAVATQAIYLVAPLACGKRAIVPTGAAVVLVATSLLGAILSFTSLKQQSARNGRSSQDLVGWLGVGVGLLFAMTVADQFAATMLVDPCLR